MKSLRWFAPVGAMAFSLACTAQRTDAHAVASAEQPGPAEVSTDRATPVAASAPEPAETASPTAQEKIDKLNSRFMGRVTQGRDATVTYRERAGAGPAATPRGLLQRIVQTMTTPPQTEGKYEVETSDVQVQGDVATSTLYACCELDDSVAGEQALVTMQHGNTGWTIQSAQVRQLCYRGLSSDGTLCQ
jgi:hypothetical protein